MNASMRNKMYGDRSIESKIIEKLDAKK